MWTPDWLYKRLPLVYALLGAALLLTFGLSGPIVLSALLLFGSAWLTAMWRRERAIENRASRFEEEWAQRRARRVLGIDR